MPWSTPIEDVRDDIRMARQENAIWAGFPTPKRL
jgi:hypothetical protein